MVEQAEAFLLERGFRECRVRNHEPVARIEVPPAELPAIVEEEARRAILARFREIGFLYVAVDMEGYIPGNMNRVLGKGAERNGRDAL
jgi:uncharacterized protein